MVTFDDFSKIPGSESIKDKIPVFALPLYASWIKIQKGYSTIWFLGEDNKDQLMIPFAVMKKGPFKKGIFLTAVLQITGDCPEDLEKVFLDRIIFVVNCHHNHALAFNAFNCSRF